MTTRGSRRTSRTQECRARAGPVHGPLAGDATLPLAPGSRFPACASPPGVRLGPYEVLSVLGTGGMAEVYRARDTRLGRDIALKVSGSRARVPRAHSWSSVSSNSNFAWRPYVGLAEIPQGVNSLSLQFELHGENSGAVDIDHIH